MQTERGIALLKTGDKDTTGVRPTICPGKLYHYHRVNNFTTSEAQLAIPNVPIDAVALQKQPLFTPPWWANHQAGLRWQNTLDPNFEVRPMVERAKKSLWKCRIIPRNMGWPFRRSISSVSPTGKHWTTKIKSLSKRFPRAGALVGTSDDGKLIDVELLLNGMSKQTLKSQNGDFFYEFELASTKPFRLFHPMLKSVCPQMRI